MRRRRRRRKRALWGRMTMTKRELRHMRKKIQELKNMLKKVQN